MWVDFIKKLPLFLSLVFSLQTLHAEDKTATEKGKNEIFIARIESMKEAVFIRNGSQYEATTAAKFLRGKWRAQAKSIVTATDFIEKIASKSSTTGKPYVIRFKAGNEINCGDFLQQELLKLERPSTKSD